MIVRHYHESDRLQIEDLHKKQGLDYLLPDLESPSMLVRAVMEEPQGISHAMFLRKTAECYWLFDPAESKRERLGRFMVMQKEMIVAAKRVGLDDVHAWIPPDVLDTKLHRTFLRLGWFKPEWASYSRKVE